ncbi:MAG: hypothetical protein IJX80_02435 [Clostridia bacterium]|nr:hypothetical protein [Clostridia bacterium]
MFPEKMNVMSIESVPYVSRDRHPEHGTVMHTVEETAQMLGYDNVYYFSRDFKDTLAAPRHIIRRNNAFSQNVP